MEFAGRIAPAVRQRIRMQEFVRVLRVRYRNRRHQMAEKMEGILRKCCDVINFCSFLVNLIY